jgi:hypothetical protein
MKPDRNKLSGSGAVRAGNNQRIAYAKGDIIIQQIRHSHPAWQAH